MSKIRSRSELKEIFVEGSYPGQQDYHDALESYVHKDDQIGMEQVAGLGAALATPPEVENLIYCHCGNEDDAKKAFPALLRGRVYERAEVES